MVVEGTEVAPMMEEKETDTILVDDALGAMDTGVASVTAVDPPTNLVEVKEAEEDKPTPVYSRFLCQANARLVYIANSVLYDGASEKDLMAAIGLNVSGCSGKRRRQKWVVARPVMKCLVKSGDGVGGADVGDDVAKVDCNSRTPQEVMAPETVEEVCMPGSKMRCV